MFKEFKEFALKGNVLDMAVGIIIGAAFTKVVDSLVKDLLTPPLALLQSGAGDFSAVVVPITPDGKTVLSVGAFANSLIQFLLVAFAVFLLVRAVNRLRRKEDIAPTPTPTTRECPFCVSLISNKATKCPHCTADVASIA